MKLLNNLIIVSFIITAILINKSNAGVDTSLPTSNDRINGFYLAISNHYKVPEKEIIVIKENKIADEELPVVFFLARSAKVKPEVIIKLRLSGRTWMEISNHFGLTAEIFYVPITVKAGPPYGQAYGHYKNKPKKKWKTIRLTDDEIVNFINLRFISDYYHCSPDEIVKMRQKGKSFIVINDQIESNQAWRKTKRKELANKKHIKGKRKKK